MGRDLEPDPEPNIYRFETHIRYDIEKGELSETEGMLKTVLKVRQNALDEATRQAFIFELERLGYTVIPPHSQETHGT